MVVQYTIDGEPVDLESHLRQYGSGLLTSEYHAIRALKPGESVVAYGETYARTEAVYHECPDCGMDPVCESCEGRGGRWSCFFCSGDWHEGQTSCPCGDAHLDLQDLMEVAQ